jgi:hypothetical protein
MSNKNKTRSFDVRVGPCRSIDSLTSVRQRIRDRRVHVDDLFHFVDADVGRGRQTVVVVLFVEKDFQTIRINRSMVLISPRRSTSIVNRSIDM